jgi:hypothetical protein
MVFKPVVEVNKRIKKWGVFDWNVELKIGLYMYGGGN